MNSTNLKELGFSEGVPLAKVSASDLPYQSGLFAILDKSVEGASDIVYIGRAKNLVGKIFGGILGGQGGKTTKKMHTMLFEEGFLGKVEICWMATDELKARRTDLLNKFKQEHGEYPSWNM
jgi:hypothetical protein